MCNEYHVKYTCGHWGRKTGLKKCRYESTTKAMENNKGLDDDANKQTRRQKQDCKDMISNKDWLVGGTPDRKCDKCAQKQKDVEKKIKDAMETSSF
jgi:hypothetical protein